MRTVDASRSFRTDNLCMVPYPRFTQEGEVDPGKSYILLFNEGQIKDLQELVGIITTPTPVAGK